VDEVLAVGDAQFQKKCLGKMEDVAEKEGRTVLFVSHNMAAVEKLCQRGIFLCLGQVAFRGDQNTAITQYLTSVTSETPSLKARLDRKGNGEVRVTGIEIRDAEGNLLEVAASGQTIDFYFYFEAIQADISRVIASLLIKTPLEVSVFLQHNRLTQNDFGALPKQGAFICRIHQLPLPAANYQVTYSLLRDGVYLDAIDNAIELSVVDGDFYGSGEVPPSTAGICLVNGEWRMEALALN